MLDSLVIRQAEAADFFIDRVFSEVRNEIAATLVGYKQEYGFKTDVNDTANTLELKNMTFAAQIHLLGSLLNASEEKRRRIFEKESNPVMQVISIVNHPKADPIVLTSVCYLIHQLLKIPEVLEDPSEVLNNIKGVKDLVDLLGRTDSDRFESMLKAAMKYNKQSRSNNEVEAQKTLVNFDDKSVMDLFMQIIRLINHFNELELYYRKKAKNNKMYEIPEKKI